MAVGASHQTGQEGRYYSIPYVSGRSVHGYNGNHRMSELKGELPVYLIPPFYFTAEETEGQGEEVPFPRSLSCHGPLHPPFSSWEHVELLPRVKMSILHKSTCICNAIPITITVGVFADIGK